MTKILLIEDNVELAEAIKHVLASYNVTLAANVAESKAAVASGTFDLIIMDLGLPDGSGFQLCTEFRENRTTRETPILILSGNTDNHARVEALDLGADDFVSKPFNKEELLARVRARLRGSLKSNVGPFVNDTRAHRITIREAGHTRDLGLTPFEYRLLTYFIQKPGQPLSREQLIKDCAGGEQGISERTVDLHICSLRKKIGKQHNMIRTVYGVGYIMQLERHKESPAAQLEK